ncbi:hypothetical protein BMS3Abin02_01829 [bacterium BMS3Abin02]|nr:hypothetical protein BMS3Abin02_01829 [bacterium BMS3Abin02]
MTEYLEPDEPRETALRATIDDLAAAVLRGDTNEEELVAAMEAVRQVPIDTSRMLNALHIPGDAGEHEAALRALLERISDGWGRWIQCGPGWYPILARLEEQLRQIDPEYRVHQIKEKFGTLRFYWEGRDYNTGEATVVDAEAESARTCELCGSPGHLRTRNSWLRTLCDDCARSEGYEDLSRGEDG